MASFLIKKSYKNSQLTFQDKMDDEQERNEHVFSMNDFITLREIGKGGLAAVDLVYYAKEEKNICIKNSK